MSKFLSLLILCFAAPLPAQVEAVRTDGTARTGKLRASDDGSFVVEFEKGSESLSQFASINNLAKNSMRPRGRSIHAIELVTGEVLHARLLRLDSETLEADTRWAKSLLIPRRVVRLIVHGSEGQPLVHEGFEEALGSHWKVDPQPRFDAVASHSGKRGLRLDLPKQGAIFSPPVLLTTGACRFWLRLLESPKPLEGGFDLGFERPIEVRWGANGFVVASPFPADVAGELPSTPGWHLVQFEWTETRFLLSIDDRVLLRAKPKELGALREVRFRQGDYGIDDLILFEPRLSRSPARLDPNADELLRRGQEQLVGRVESLGEDGVEFVFRKSKRLLPWTEVRTLSFAASKFEPKSMTGQKVSVGLASLDGGRDTIEGILRSLSDKGLTLDHPALGSISIPADEWRELRPR